MEQIVYTKAYMRTCLSILHIIYISLLIPSSRSILPLPPLLDNHRFVFWVWSLFLFCRHSHGLLGIFQDYFPYTYCFWLVGCWFVVDNHSYIRYPESGLQAFSLFPPGFHTSDCVCVCVCVCVPCATDCLLCLFSSSVIQLSAVIVSLSLSLHLLHVLIENSIVSPTFSSWK